mgnify:CR=1 FL=1
MKFSHTHTHIQKPNRIKVKKKISRCFNQLNNRKTETDTHTFTYFSWSDYQQPPPPPAQSIYLSTGRSIIFSVKKRNFSINYFIIDQWSFIFMKSDLSSFIQFQKNEKKNRYRSKVKHTQTVGVRITIKTARLMEKGVLYTQTHTHTSKVSGIFNFSNKKKFPKLMKSIFFFWNEIEAVFVVAEWKK